MKTLGVLYKLQNGCFNCQFWCFPVLFIITGLNKCLINMDILMKQKINKCLINMDILMKRKIFQRLVPLYTSGITILKSNTFLGKLLTFLILGFSTWLIDWYFYSINRYNYKCHKIIFNWIRATVLNKKLLCASREIKNVSPPDPLEPPDPHLTEGT